MCHQAVGLIAGELEKRGIATTSVTLLKEVTKRVRTPRALAVPYALGYPFGRADDPELQTRILEAAFGLLALSGPPPVLVDFEG